jgi:hypothetical protein
VTPEQLRDEASAAKAQANLLGPGPDRDWLNAKAAALRREADRRERRLDARADRLDPPASPPPSASR